MAIICIKRAWRRLKPGLHTTEACNENGQDRTIGFLALQSLISVLTISCLHAQTTNDVDARLRTLEERLSHIETRLARQMDEQLWFQQLQPIAECEKVSFAGPAPHNANASPGSNMVVVSAMTFLPRHRSHFGKLPLIVLAHGEIHG